MRFEIAVHGPGPFLDLLSRSIGRELACNPGFSMPVKAAEHGKAGLIMLALDQQTMERTLLWLSREIEALERSLSMPPGEAGLCVRNLEYGEPSLPSVTAETFRPVPFLAIHPWNGEAQPPGHCKGIILDSTGAFGSGTHPSTILCLEILGAMSRADGLREKKILDFGCGTGILAMAAIKLGASIALGVEIDPDAANTARRNISLNGMAERIEIRQGSLDAVKGLHHIVIANLVAAAHMRVGAGLAGFVCHGGALLISGFTGGQRGVIEEQYLRSGLEIDYQMEREGWGATLLLRP